METLTIKTAHDLRRPSLFQSVNAHVNKHSKKPDCRSGFFLIPSFRICSKLKYLLASVLALMISIPLHAEPNWQTVNSEKVLLEFSNAKRYMVQQSRDWQSTLERSAWMLDDGSVMYFHVTWMGPRWVLVKGGESLKELFQRAFPTSELVEVGEPFLNRDRGTRGHAQWLRYRDGGSHCILVRQYGWDDDSDVDGRVAIGNRVAVGYRCADVELTHPEIRELIERIHF